MNPNLFITLMVVLAAANLWLGKRASKVTRSEDDFFLSGRRLGFWKLLLTILATQLGGGIVLGASEEAYHRGWIVLIYPLGCCLGLAAVSLGFGAKLRQMNISTIPELFEKKFGSRKLRHIASTISIVSLFIVLIAQGIALKMFFIALGYSDPWVLNAFWMILVLYTVMGGLTAVVNTDILQVLLIIGAFISAFAISSFSGIAPSVSEVSFDQTGIPWVGWLLMPLLYMFVEQDMAQRFFAAKKPKLVTWSTGVAAITLFTSILIPIYFGVKAAESGMAIPEGASVLLTSVQTFTGPITTTFFTVAVLMAVVSTADTTLCSISSNVAYDFKMFHHKQVIWAQAITLTIGMLSLGAAHLFSSVITVLIFSFELSVSVLFVPVILGVFQKSPKKGAAIGSMIGGGIGFALFKVYPVVIPGEIATLIFSLAGYFMGSVGVHEKLTRRACLQQSLKDQ